MFHKITLSDYVKIEDFNKGFGLYLIDYKGLNGLINDVHFYSPKHAFCSAFCSALDITENMPQEFLDLFEEKEQTKEVESNTNLVSEEFALKAMAIAKANSQTIKVSDILNTNSN